MTTVSSARTAGKWIARIALWSALATLVALGAGARAGFFRTLVVRSGSMGAAMPTGSLAVVSPQEPSQIKVGQIITYHVPGMDNVVVSHRVIEVDTAGAVTTFRTKGDRNERPDPWTARVTGATAWQVRASVPGLGWAVVAFRIPWVRLAASVVAPMLLAMLSLAAIWSKPKSDRPFARPAAGANPAPEPRDLPPPTAVSGKQLEWSALANGTGGWNYDRQAGWTA